eukprot:gnl/MRDRNA2_/MRDRNA2_110196_c0_seq1.p1 gnl/MRDRNA2_/MRDRNA2_110196_c0~~gnl/MRDRNA2_/MRDRNA2_110196_c0_seq1.p1  ORF type:complete len:1705 (-),score=352.90 gnl/MRDRNA2_/MRDRNA2_110196_c0_seq1:103-5217(-)
MPALPAVGLTYEPSSRKKLSVDTNSDDVQPVTKSYSYGGRMSTTSPRQDDLKSSRRSQGRGSQPVAMASNSLNSSSSSALGPREPARTPNEGKSLSPQPGRQSQSQSGKHRRTSRVGSDSDTESRKRGSIRPNRSSSRKSSQIRSEGSNSSKGKNRNSRSTVSNNSSLSASQFQQMVTETKLGGFRVEKPSERRRRLAAEGMVDSSSPPSTPTTSALQQSMFFREIGTRLGQRLSSGAEERHFNAGELVYSEGDEQDWLGFLDSGKLGVFARLEDERGNVKSVRIGEVPPLSAFGELEALGVRSKRVTSMVSLGESVVLVMSKKNFWKALEKDPSDGHLAKFEALANRWRAFLAAPLLEGLHPAVQQQVRANSEMLTYEAGQVISEQGAETEAALVLEEGTVVTQVTDFVQQPDELEVDLLMDQEPLAAIGEDTIGEDTMIQRMTSTPNTQQSSPAAGSAPGVRHTVGGGISVKADDIDSPFTGSPCSRKSRAFSPQVQGMIPANLTDTTSLPPEGILFPKQRAPIQRSTGAVFDEEAALGVTSTCQETRTADATCHVAVIKRSELWDLVKDLPRQRGRLERLALSKLPELADPLETNSVFKLIKSWSPGVLEELRPHLRRRVYPPGSALQREGTEGDAMYIVQHGLADVSIIGRKFDKVLTGGYYGEMALLGVTARRTTSIVAQELCVLQELRRQDLDKNLQRHNAVRVKLREIAKLRLHVMRPPGSRASGPLRELPFFKGVSDDFLGDISDHLEDRLYIPGQIMIREGDRGDFMVIMHSGCADVMTEGEKIAELGPRSLFGEVALLGVSSVRTGTVVASLVCCVQLLHRVVLTRAVERHPSEKRHFEKLAASQMEGAVESKFSIYLLPLFKDCPSRFLYLLDLHLERRLCFTDEIIVEEGTEGEEMFIICSGIADVEINGTKVGEFQEGTCFGEMAALGISRKRTATIRARMICDVRILHRHYLENAFAEFPDERRRFETLAALRMRKKAQTEVPFFQKCDPEFMMALATEMDDKLYVANQCLVTEGEIGDCMFILHKGQANVTMDGELVTVMEDGEVFGEIAVLGISKVRTATITAITDCFVQVLHRPRLVKVLKRFPHERQRFDMIAAKRIEERLYQDSVRELQFFRGIPRGFVEFLDTHLERRIFFAGDKIVQEGDPAYHFFILFSGCADIYIGGNEVGELHAGECFGEMALLKITETRGATVQARDLCDTQVITASKLFQGISLFPEQRQRFVELATKRMKLNLEKLQGPSLDKIAVFEGCDELFLENIANHLQDKIYFPGDCLCREGEQGDCMFILVQGSADIEVGDPPNKVGSLEPGQILGEIVVLGLRPVRTATIRARDLCFVQLLRQDVLMRYLDIFTDELVRFQEIAADRLKQVTLPPLLKEQHLFEKSHPDFVQVLETRLERRFYFAKRIIFEEGSDGTEMYLLRHGRAAVEMYECKFGEIHPGTAFGELAMLGNARKRMATVSSELLCDVQVLSQETLERTLAEFPMEKAKLEHHVRVRKNLDKVKQGILATVRFRRQIEQYKLKIPRVGVEGEEWTFPVKPGEMLPVPKDADEEFALGLQVCKGCVKTKISELEEEIRIVKNDTEDTKEQCVAYERSIAAMEAEVMSTRDRSGRLAAENKELLHNAQHLWRCIEALESLKKQVERSIQLQTEAIQDSLRYETVSLERHGLGAGGAESGLYSRCPLPEDYA